MKYNISKVNAREILDSRGNPTIEVEVTLEDGTMGRASVPSGASTGTFESIELRDKEARYHGKGVLKAVQVVKKKIAPKIIGLDAREQRSIDMLMNKLDGTNNKRNLGGNAILGVSLAVAKAAASANDLWLYEYINIDSNLLPIPFFNVINGGKHAGNKLDFQEFMIAPVGVKNFKNALQIGSEIYHTLKEILRKEYGSNAINVGDEGGFSPPIGSPDEALDAIMMSIEELGYRGKVRLALDVAANSFYKDQKYIVMDKTLSCLELIDLYEDLVKSYPIISIEDPLYEDDFEGFVEATRTLPVQIMGDDLFVTNSNRLKKGIKMGACNALLLKVNQPGSLTEALEAAKIAFDNGFRVMASHRSGETEDSFVADLSVGIECGQIKSGAPCRGERTVKYNQLIRIEERLGKKARYNSSIFK